MLLLPMLNSLKVFATSRQSLMLSLKPFIAEIETATGIVTLLLLSSRCAVTIADIIGITLALLCYYSVIITIYCYRYYYYHYCYYYYYYRYGYSTAAKLLPRCSYIIPPLSSLITAAILTSSQSARVFVSNMQTLFWRFYYLEWRYLNSRNC